jgi:exonuclease VII small subunit
VKAVPRNREVVNFETSLQGLERIVREMEAGDLP